jgi:HAE1 family hydrophobic/amphiphilic exporter-1
MRWAAAFVCAGVLGAQTAPRVGVGGAERRLALADAVRMALENNLEVEVEKQSIASAEQAIRAARGAFDYRFQWLPGIEKRSTPTANVLQAPDGNFLERTFANRFVFLRPVEKTGGNFNVDFRVTRFSNNNIFAALNPLVSSTLAVNFAQPLARNRKTDLFRTEIKVRNRQRDIAAADFELRVIDVVTRVEQAYWSLVAARQSVDVAREAENLAREQLARNERMIAAGTLAPVEISASRAELERRRDNFFLAISQLTDAENALKLLLTPDRRAALWNEAIEPVDRRVDEPQDTADLAARVERAIARRPELRQLALRQESNQLQRDLASSQLKPQVDLILSYQNAGIGGALRPGDNPFAASSAAQFGRLNDLSRLAGLPPLVPTSFGTIPGSFLGGTAEALAGVFTGSFPTYSATLQFDLNPRNRTAEANLAQTAIAAKRLKLEQARFEQLVEAQMRGALQTLESARQRITAAQAAEAAARDKFDSELRLFQTGESTNFLVLTRQNEYLEARLRSVLAQLEFNRAVSRLEQASGRTLETYGVRLQ